MPATQRVYMHDGKLLDYQELQSEARKRVEESDLSHSQIADELDVTRSIVTKAITLDPGPRYSHTQTRIIGLLSDYEVNEEVRFRVVEREGEDA